MRPCRICALIWGLAAAGAFAAGSNPPHAPVTIVLQFEDSYSPRSLDEMKREFVRATRESFPIEWRMRDRISGDMPGDLVMFTFKGRCVMETAPPFYDETGPLASTNTVDGAPLPFGQVSCDQVRKLIWNAMWGGDFAHGDQLLGRALGRVLAHEFYHMRAKTTAHSSTGVTKPALSGAQLISDTLTIDEDSLNRMDADRR